MIHKDITRIALDFDGTFNRVPELFNFMLQNAPKQDTLIVFVTMRFINEGIEPYLPLYNRNIIYTGRMAKQDYVEKMGYKFDIWIDDNPHFLFQEAWRDDSDHNPTSKHAKNHWRDPKYASQRTEGRDLSPLVHSILRTGRLATSDLEAWKQFSIGHFA